MTKLGPIQNIRLVCARASMRSLGVLIVGGFLALFPIAQAESVIDTLETQGAVRALDDLRLAWLSQLDDLIATARALAVQADDTYPEFTKRPNIPYVHAHYNPEQLAAYRIDTVLIANLQGTPLFWRRINQGVNRGAFPGRAPVPCRAATPGSARCNRGAQSCLARAATLVHGPKLLVAMPHSLRQTDPALHAAGSSSRGLWTQINGIATQHWPMSPSNCLILSRPSPTALTRRRSRSTHAFRAVGSQTYPRLHDGT